jgi:excinuclease ABC subunit A
LLSVPEIEAVVVVDQSPIGYTPASNPGTYTKVWDHVRELFARTPDARRLGFGKDRFSFNNEAGNCAACGGRGATLVEMHFLSDVWVTCEVCRGERYNEQTLQVRYAGLTIAGVLRTEIAKAHELFADVPAINRILGTLVDVGLGYIRLGQPSTTLSGGEAQRLKLASELARRVKGQALYVLDEPTTGLHFEDVARLIDVLNRLVDAGHTVITIEHNPDVIRCSDWVIDLGPEGGAAGGKIVAAGTPEEVAAVGASHTGRALRGVLGERASRTT